MKALVVYHSKTGITRGFAYEINKYLKENNLDSEMINILDVKAQEILKADILFIGCWTHGLFIFMQHPDKTWRENAAILPNMDNKKVAFFTTYKLATGSMFSCMQKVLNGKLFKPVELKLKSRNGQLTNQHREVIKRFIDS